MGLRSDGGTPSWLKEVPRIPLWNLGRTEARALQIFEAAVKPWRNAELTTAARTEIAEMILVYLAGSARKREAAMAAVETLLPYSAKLMTKELARLLCFQFSANAKRILKGVPVRPFTGIGASEWMPLEITSVDRVSHGRMTCAVLNVVVLDGPYAGFRAKRVIPLGYLRVMANDLGFSRQRQFESDVDVVDMHMAAWVEPSQSESLVINKYWLTSSMAERNNALVKKRKSTPKEREERGEPV